MFDFRESHIKSPKKSLSFQLLKISSMINCVSFSHFNKSISKDVIRELDDSFTKERGLDKNCHHVISQYHHARFLLDYFRRYQSSVMDF